VRELRVIALVGLVGPWLGHWLAVSGLGIVLPPGYRLLLGAVTLPLVCYAVKPPGAEGTPPTRRPPR
jgi:hypothetical protein